MNDQNLVLRLRDLEVGYNSSSRQGRAVRNLSLEINPGEALALVGESGCGKSTAALSILRLLPKQATISGLIEFEGQDLANLSDRDFTAIRGRHIGMVFQEPLTALNPVYRIGWQIGEVFRRHLGVSAHEARARALEVLERVVLPDAKRLIDCYPHELSGGQRQRVMIAIAIALRPRLLIADEPTTALDVSVQHEILTLIDTLRRELGMAVLLISHDLPVVSRFADNVVVMHHGEVMERVPAPRLFDEARHPYTRGLIGASLRNGDGRHYTNTRLSDIRAEPANDGEWSFKLETGTQPTSVPVSEPGPETVLTVESLVVEYSDGSRRRRAVDGVSFDIRRGTTLGLVGESGCGKSTLCRAIVGLVRPSEGNIKLRDVRLDQLNHQEWRPLRRRIQMVFQDPYASLNPRQDVETALNRLLLANGVNTASERNQRIRTALDQVALPRTALKSHPHEFSGGQRQRVAIARALILRPELVVCDEPVSALDVSVQAQILNLMVDLKHELSLTLLFISHDLGVIRYMADDVMVMQNGRVVDKAGIDGLWDKSRHPYTRQLLSSAI